MVTEKERQKQKLFLKDWLIKGKTELCAENEIERRTRQRRLGGEELGISNNPREITREVRKNTKTEKIAELFGGTERQRVEREKMEEIRRIDKAKQRESKVRTRVREIEIGKKEQRDSVREQESNMIVKQEVEKQKMVVRHAKTS